MATRYDPDGALCLCYKCHIHRWHHEPMEAAHFMETNWPGRYDKLKLKSNAITKLDLQLVRLSLIQDLEKLGLPII